MRLRSPPARSHADPRSEVPTARSGRERLGNDYLRQMHAERAAASAATANQTLPFLGEMEEAFGEDLSNVKVGLGQTDLRDRGIRGTANGDHVAFADASPDRWMVAHEIAHVVQARHVGDRGPRADANAEGSPAEAEAEEVADAVAAGQVAPDVTAATAGTQMDGDPPVDDAVGGGGALLEYQAALRDLYQKIDAGIAEEVAYMRSKGVPEAQIAEWSVRARNEAKMRVRTWDALKTWAEARNVAKYGDPIGPSYSQLRSGDPARNISPRTDVEIANGASRSNAAVNRWAGRLRIAGRIFIGVDLAVSGYRVWNAPAEQRPQTFIRELSGFAGAMIGGWAGAKGGALAGGAIGGLFGGAGAAPGALIGGVLGGIGGAIGGAWAGNQAGEWIVDELYPVAETGFEAGTP